MKVAEDSFSKLKKKIIVYSKLIGIDKIGFTTGEPFTEVIPVLEEHKLKGFASGLEAKDIRLRIDPNLSLPGVKSIISIAVAYPNQIDYRADDQEPRGMFARVSWGKDYHVVLREKLMLLAAYLRTLVPECRTCLMVDTGPLSDRAVARRAGLGWIGRNGSLITREFGSFVYLGELLTDLPLEADCFTAEGCGECRRCIAACPAQAIQGNSLIDCQKCLAFQTINKGSLTDETKEKIAENTYIYGCDACQLACPFNKDKKNDWHQEFRAEYCLLNPSLKDLLQVSNKEFTRRYGSFSGSWRGKKVLQRNALFILGSLQDKKNLLILQTILQEDLRPDIRAAAAWAVGKHDSPEACRILELSLQKEQEPLVSKEIKKALTKQQRFKTSH
ncbi:MAG: tRNA epoxyqueuosine(34) reductase QueG [Peptococcaceae bacterium]